MKIIIECPEIGIASLIEAVQNKTNEYAEREKNTDWSQLQTLYRVQERLLHNILIQIADQVNGVVENDG